MLLLITGLCFWALAGLCAVTYTRLPYNYWRDVLYAFYIIFLALGAPSVGFGLSAL